MLTSLKAGNANQGIPDEEVLAFAVAERRIVLTFNRRHFISLHRYQPAHAGIIICTEDSDAVALAKRIHEAAGINLENQLVRVNRPNL